MVITLEGKAIFEEASFSSHVQTSSLLSFSYFTTFIAIAFPA